MTLPLTEWIMPSPHPLSLAIVQVLNTTGWAFIVRSQHTQLCMAALTGWYKHSVMKTYPMELEWGHSNGINNCLTNICLSYFLASWQHTYTLPYSWSWLHWSQHVPHIPRRCCCRQQSWKTVFPHPYYWRFYTRTWWVTATHPHLRKFYLPGGSDWSGYCNSDHWRWWWYAFTYFFSVAVTKLLCIHRHCSVCALHLEFQVIWIDNVWNSLTVFLTKSVETVFQLGAH